MELTIQKLTPAQLDDWLAFFDRDAFSDNGDWCGCYCMCYHWDEELNRQSPWNCDKASAPRNRAAAIERIRDGRMQGYLAYADGRVVGWCNANVKAAYHNVNFDIPKEIPDAGEKILSVACFVIAPAYRGQGVATALLHAVCRDAEARGFAMVEAYPFAHDENNGYHGTVAMYEHAGFKACGTFEGCRIVRKIFAE